VDALAIEFSRNRAGHRIEVLAIDWDHLRKVFALDPGREPKSTWQIEDLVGEVLTLGEIEVAPSLVSH